MKTKFDPELIFHRYIMACNIASYFHTPDSVRLNRSFILDAIGLEYKTYSGVPMSVRCAAIDGTPCHRLRAERIVKAVSYTPWDYDFATDTMTPVTPREDFTLTDAEIDKVKLRIKQYITDTYKEND